MIYLKKTEDGTVVAYCDSETLTLLTGAERADLEVSDEDWAAAGYCAHCEEEAIVLGPVWSLEEARNDRIQAINTAYDAALTATLTMPAENPASAEIALAALDFQAEDAEGLAYVRGLLADRRQELTQSVEIAQTAEEIEALKIDYPV